MSGCVDLVSGVGQLAQNATMGIAALCGQPNVPPAAGDPASAQNSRDFALASSRQRTPQLAALGKAKTLRGLAPTAAAEFAAIGTNGVRSALMPPRIAAEAPGRSALATTSSTVATPGYIYFDNIGDSENSRLAATVRKQNAGLDSPPLEERFTGDSASDVQGDNRDLTRDIYDAPPDSLLSRGGLTLSAGYSSVEGVSVGAKISRQNIGGRDREVAASARWSQLRQLFEAGYGDGNFLGSAYGFAPKLFAHRTTARGFGRNMRGTPFTQSAYGLVVQMSRKFDDRWSANLSYRLSSDSFRMDRNNVACDVATLGSPLCNEIGRTTNSLLTFTASYDQRTQNAPVTRGYKLRFSQDLGVGGSAPFTRTRLGGDAHIGLSERWTLTLEAEGGYLAPLGKRAAPLFDRFYAGDTSLRGFDLRGVGPKVRPAQATLGQDIAVGGRVYYVARTELTGAMGGVFARYGVQPSVFVDAGSVFDAKGLRLLPGETLYGNSAKPRVSAGFGLTMKTPGGTLRIDLARPLVRQPGDRPKTFSITFGAAV